MSDNTSNNTAAHEETIDLETEAFVEAYLRPPTEYRAYIAERLASFREESLDRAA